MNETRQNVLFKYARCPECGSLSKYRRESDKKIVCKVCRCVYEIEVSDAE